MGFSCLASLRRPREDLSILLKRAFWRQVGSKMRRFSSKMPSEKTRFSVRKNRVRAKLAQNPPLKGPGASPRPSWEGPGDLLGWTRRQEAFQEASGIQKWPPRAPKMTQNRLQNEPKSNPKWPPKEPISISIFICLFQKCNTPTHQTFINKHTNSPNFHQRTHQKWISHQNRSTPQNVRRRCPRLRVQ